MIGKILLYRVVDGTLSQERAGERRRITRLHVGGVNQLDDAVLAAALSHAQADSGGVRQDVAADV